MAFAKIETFKKGSQFEQDKLIIELFKEKRDGYFVDIGCADGELINNTIMLEKEYNWSGLSVDPFPVNFENRKSRVAKEAVFDGSEVEFSCADFLGGIRHTLDTHKERIKDAKILKLKSITPRNLLHKYNTPCSIDFLSLDTEGSEYEILRLFPFDTYKVNIILVEHNNEEEKRKKIYYLLKSKGYKRTHTLFIDDIYSL